jgi:hypothetical protein
MSCGGIKAGDHRHCGPCGRVRPVVTCPFCITGSACVTCLDCPDCPAPADLMELLRDMTVVSPLHYGAANLSRPWPRCRGRLQRLPRRACSRSMASNSALKLPLPKPSEPCRSISSKNTVGRSCTGLVKICSR